MCGDGGGAAAASRLPQKITIPPPPPPSSVSLMGHLVMEATDDLEGFESTSNKSEYPVDPSLPDANINIYGTDEFRMFYFKVLPCSRAYYHDWTACPFVHPGESARRRDPRRCRYSCFPCLSFRRGGACSRGDLCMYAHGVFERWLHPAQYRTRLCKDGRRCARRVCFFAHTFEELRPAFMASPLQSPPLYGGEMTASTSSARPVLNHLPGLNDLHSIINQSSVLRIRDRSSEDLAMIPNFRLHQIYDFYFSAGREYPVWNCINTATKLHQSLPSILNTNFKFSTKTADHRQLVSEHPALLQASLGNTPSEGMTSRSNIERNSYLSSRISELTRGEKPQRHPPNPINQDLHVAGIGLPSITGSPYSSWTNRQRAPLEKVDQKLNGEVLGRYNRSMPFELASVAQEPDVSWVQSLVGLSEMKMKYEMRSAAIADKGALDGCSSDFQMNA